MKRKTIAALLLIALLLSVLPAQAAAVNGTVMTGAPVEGDKVAIYNIADQMTMVHSITEGGYRIPAGSCAGGVLCNGALIFTVHVDGIYYTFENQGRYLCANDDEDLFFSPTQTEFTKWTLTTQGSGWLIENKAAVYAKTGRNVCLEYYKSAFCGWTYNGGSTAAFSQGFYRVDDPQNIGLVVDPSGTIVAPDAYIGRDYDFTVQVYDYTKITSLYATYSLDGGAAKQVFISSYYGTTYVYTIPAAELAGHSRISIYAQAVNECGFTYSMSGTAIIRDEPLLGQTVPIYDTGTDTQTRPEIAAELVNCGNAPTLFMTVDGAAVSVKLSGGRATYTPAYDLSVGAHTVFLRVTRADGRMAEKSWEFYVGSRQVRAYFGQLHSHTNYSDGAGSLAEAYQHAMSANNVDYLIVTDHSNYFDTRDTATINSYYNLSSREKTGSTTKWEQARATAAEYDAMSEDFVAAYGYEMTWSSGPGHTNTFNTYGVVSRNNSVLNEKLGFTGMHLYNDLMVNANRGLDENGTPITRTKYIANAPVVSQLNHPGVTFGTFDEYAGYNADRDEVVCLIEVGNGSGSVLNSGYWRSYSEYDKCLAMGWHVAPTNNQDNHGRRWGNSNTHRSVILTNDFSEAGLYRAMSQRRVYATEDHNLTIYYYLNGALMGDIIQSNDAQVHITANITDPDGERISTVSVIGENGQTVQTYTVTGSTCALDVQLNNTQNYYYLKIVEADGDIAVTAPVWVEPETGCRHEWDAGTVTAAATCTAEGEAIFTCLRCGATKTEDLPALGHDIVIDTAIPATCTTSGLTAGEHCTRCDYKVAQEVVPATGHQHAYPEHRDATCTEPGYDRTVCDDCGALLSETILPALGHDLIDHPAKPATCTAPGWYAYQTCSRCEYSTYEAIAALGHAIVIDAAAVAPTCTTPGSTAGEHCTRCDYAVAAEVLPALGHDYAVTQSVDATCTAGGSVTCVCARCGDAYTDTIAPLGHDIQSYAAKAPTCTEVGWDAYETCLRCGWSTYQVLPELGHAWDEGVITKPATAYKAGEKTFTCARCGQTRTETIPAEQTEPCDGGKDCPSYRFTDVKASDWYHEAVDFAVENELFNGMSETSFGPNTAMTRAMLVTVLWRYAGEPAVGKNSFTDVPNGRWYSDAVAWAAKNGIVTGVGSNRFDPNGNVTREQLAAILYRYAASVGKDVSADKSLSGFADRSKVSGWAEDAVRWTVAEGIIGGAEQGGRVWLLPQDNATRAQVAKMLMQFIRNVMES